MEATNTQTLKSEAMEEVLNNLDFNAVIQTQKVKMVLDTFEQLAEAQKIHFIDKLIALVTQNPFTSLTLSLINKANSTSLDKPFDLIKLIIPLIFKVLSRSKAAESPLYQGLMKLIPVLLEAEAADKSHFDMVYSLISGLLGPIETTDGIKSVFESVTTSITLLHMMTKIDYARSKAERKEQNLQFFHFLQGATSISVLEANSSPWIFNEGFTFVTWFYPLDCGEESKDKGPSVIFRLSNGKTTFECYVKDYEVYYRIMLIVEEKETLCSGLEKPFGKLQKNAWNSVTFMHDLSVTPSRCTFNIGNEESTISLPFTINGGNTKEITFYENIQGASSIILLYHRAVPLIQLRNLIATLPYANYGIDSFADFEKISTEDLYLCFLPFFSSKDIIHNFSNTSPARNIKAQLKGANGIYKKGKRHVDTVKNITPFIHLAQYLEEEESRKLLNKSLKLVLAYIHNIEIREETATRSKNECRTLVDALGCHIQKLQPKIINEKTIKLLSTIAQQNSYLQARILKMLINTINFWLNTNSTLYTLYWETIKVICAHDYKKHYHLLKVETVLLMMETIGTSCGNTPGCCEHELQKYYAPMITFIEFSMHNQSQTMNAEINKLLYAVNKKPCHCMIMSLLKLLYNLCGNDIEYAKTFDSLKGLKVVFGAVENYSMDVRIACLKLVVLFVDLRKKNKIESKEKVVEFLKGIFPVFKNIQAVVSQDEESKKTPSAKPKGKGKDRKKKRRSVSAKGLKTVEAVAKSSVKSDAQKSAKSLLDAAKAKQSIESKNSSSDGKEAPGITQDDSVKASQIVHSVKSKDLSKIYNDAAEYNTSHMILKFGKVNSDVFQLYNYLLLWALSINVEEYYFNHPALKKKIKFKDLVVPNRSLLILNGEAINFILHLIKVTGSAKLTKKVIKDILQLCAMYPENRKALLLQDYFLKKLIKLEHKLYYQLRMIQDGSTVKLAKYLVKLITELSCEGLRLTSTILHFLKSITFANYICEGKKVSALLALSTSASSKLIWFKILSEFCVLLCAHKPMNSQVIAWQNIPNIIVVTVKMLLTIDYKCDKEQLSLQEVGQDELVAEGSLYIVSKKNFSIVSTLFDIVSNFWNGELAFLNTLEINSESKKEIETKCREIFTKPKISSLVQHLKLLAITVKDEESEHKISKNMTVSSALALLMTINMNAADEITDLEFWAKKIGVFIKYFLLVMEYSKIAGEGTVTKIVTHELTLLFGVLIKTYVSCYSKDKKEEANIISKNLEAAFKFMAIIMSQVPHSTVAEYYKKYFVMGHGRLLVPIEQVAQFESVLNVLNSEHKAFFQATSMMKELQILDRAQEELWLDVKVYATNVNKGMAFEKQRYDIEVK